MGFTDPGPRPSAISFMCPRNALQRDGGKVAEHILSTILDNEDMGGVIIHLNVPVLLGYRHVSMLERLVEVIKAVHLQYHEHSLFAVAFRSDGDPEIEVEKRRHRQRLVAAGIPVFD